MLTLSLLVCALPCVAALHPAAGQITRDVQASYGLPESGYPASFSRDDLSFGSSYPAADELGPAERYMLAGTLSSNLPDQRPLDAWISEVERVCLDYCSQYSELPAVLDADLLRELNPDKPGSEIALAASLLANPFSGQAPRLNQRDFAPGELYIRPLSRAEMLRYAALDEDLHASWFGDLASGNCVELDCPVLYVRAYGSRGVIYENFAWRATALEPEIGEVIALLEPQKRYVSDEEQQSAKPQETALPPAPEKKACRTGGG